MLTIFACSTGPERRRKMAALQESLGVPTSAIEPEESPRPRRRRLEPSTPAPGPTDVAEEVAVDAGPTPPLDEMAALDAGWDDVLR